MERGPRHCTRRRTLADGDTLGLDAATSLESTMMCLSSATIWEIPYGKVDIGRRYGLIRFECEFEVVKIN